MSISSPLSFSKREGLGVSCVRDAEGGGERSEPLALPCGHFEGDKSCERVIKRWKIVVTRKS